MQINWKLRLRNRGTLTAIVGAVLTFVYSLSNALGIELPIEMETASGAIMTAIAALVVIGVVIDPTTEGFSDSELAMGYEEPRKDE